MECTYKNKIKNKKKVCLVIIFVINLRLVN